MNPALPATTVATGKVKINFPVWTADPAVGWYNETDGATDDVECIPTKTAGLTPISNEPGVVRLMLSPFEYTLDFNGATGGTATVSLDGNGPSATIAFNAASSAVKTAIVGIDDGIEAADVTVTGSAGVYTVTVPDVQTVNGASLTGGTGASVTVA